MNFRGKIYIGGRVVSNNIGAPDIIQVIDPTTHDEHVSHDQLPLCLVKQFALTTKLLQLVG